MKLRRYSILVAFLILAGAGVLRQGAQAQAAGPDIATAAIIADYGYTDGHDCYDRCDCPRSPGFWMNHPEAWPVSKIIIGACRYTKCEAIELMKAPVKGNKVLTLFPALVAAKLNVIACRDYRSTICLWILLGDLWMARNVEDIECDVVKASSAAWQGSWCEIGGELIYLILDAYDNGCYCEEWGWDVIE